jgi:hypothetical protein
MDYKARLYSPYLNRFLQPDSIIPDQSNPQSWNRFSYVQNNPIRFNDPTGHMMWEGDDGGCYSCTPTPPVDPPGGGEGGNGGGGNNDCDIECELDETLQDIEHAFYYNPILGGSSSGCNTWVLHNGSDWCHHTTYTSQPVCLPIVHCSSKEEWEYALSFQYPGQSPWNPVVGGDEKRHVMGGDFFTSWQWLRDKGAITVSIRGQTIINTTEKTHIFHQGDIYRTVSGGYVTTVGYGTNTNPAVAALNQYGGPIAFQFNDFAMTSLSTLDKLLGGALLP